MLKENIEQPICMYCGKPIEEGNLEMKRIWSPNWRREGGQSPPRPYHKKEGCGADDQMAHEG
jgi:hypothetical protein